MELFTLGIGNYTENDIKNSARAFTGWSHDGEQYQFRPGQHDMGMKSFLGYIGNFNGDDIIEIILRQPACAPFIAGEMYKYFVSEYLDPKLGAALGSVLHESDYELRPFLRKMFTSRAFYSPDAIGSQIKSPVQLVVGTARLLGVELPQQKAVVGTLTQMGQVPFMPPNVRGWLGGRNWINTSTVFVRYNAGVWLSGGDLPGLLKGRLNGKDPKIQDAPHIANVEFDPQQDSSPSTDQVVDEWLARLIQRPVDKNQKSILVEAVGEFPDRPQALRKLVQLITAMPEYQLC
jgi:hypothetical protein